MMQWLQKMVCHGEHTYLYSQLLMHSLAAESKGGSNMRRLCQEVHKSARSKYVILTSYVLVVPRTGHMKVVHDTSPLVSDAVCPTILVQVH